MHLFPAQAGVILDATAEHSLDSTVPRASGGDPWGFSWAGVREICSPRKRG